MARFIRVLLVDPDQENRTRLRKQLGAEGLSVVGEATMGMEAYTVARESDPEAILVGVNEPLARSLQTIEALTMAQPETIIVAVSSLRDPQAIRKTMLAGARDCLIQPVKASEIRQAIERLGEKEQKRREEDGEAPIKYGTIVTVFGAKGGIGKTTLAANLSIALSQLTYDRVVVVDLDNRFGDIAVLMNISPKRTIADLAADIESVTLDTVGEYVTQHPSGVHIVAAPISPDIWPSCKPEDIGSVITHLSRWYDYVIVDTPGAFNDVVAKALQLSTVILLVSSLDIASLKDTVMSLNMIRSWPNTGDKLKLTINCLNQQNGMSNRQLEEVVGWPVFRRLPYDKHVIACGHVGRPVVTARPRATFSHAIESMASGISGVRLKSNRQSLLTRLMHLLRRNGHAPAEH